jgi:hypothetical protein
MKMKILAKACRLPESEPVVKKNDPRNEGMEAEGPAKSLSKEAIAKMDPATRSAFLPGSSLCLPKASLHGRGEW